MEDEPTIGIFEYDSKPLEAWISGRHWCVRYRGREVEARSMGEALEEVMGNAKDPTERRRRDRLIIDILLWSQGDAAGT